MVLFPLWGQRSYCFPNRFISSIPLEFHTPFALHGWPRNRNVFHSTFLFVFFRPRSANASSRGVEGHRHTTQRSIHTEAGTVRSDTPLTWGWTHICETAIYIYIYESSWIFSMSCVIWKQSPFVTSTSGWGGGGFPPKLQNN